MERESPDLSHLLSAGPAYLPLNQDALRPGPDSRKLQSEDAASLFPGAPHRDAAFAGLLFRVGCWPESHAVAQGINSIEGSYWHGMLHRIEPDSFNAKYWFRRVGEHAIFPELLRSTAQILKTGGPKHWRLNEVWDPLLFIDWCDEARATGGGAERAAIDIQMAEWQLLFDWCAGIDPTSSCA